jgi:LysM repeat protein
MKTKSKKEKKLLLNLIDGERHRHRVALVTEEGEWNQHEPNSGMARMFVVMLLVHVILIGGIIVYDFMDAEETPQQTVTQAARAMSGTSGLPQAAPDIVNAQALAVSDVAEYDNYEMRSGDSLGSIAAKFGTTEQEITELNMIDKGLQIGPGTMLRVPKQAVLSAIPVDPQTLKPVAAAAEDMPVVAPLQDQPPATQIVPSEAVKPSEAPASISAAALTPMSLVAPTEEPPVPVSLAAAADSAAALPVPAETPALPAPVNPRAVSLLQENVPAEPAAKAQPKALPKPSPVAPPSQMLKKIASQPPATKKTEPVKKTVPAPAPKAAGLRSHTLQPGETLYRLSMKYGVSVDAIQKANSIKDPNSIRDGVKLMIPSK